MIVAPVAVERTLVGPERIDEIEALFFYRRKRDFESGQRMQRGGGGEQVGEWGVWRGEKAALGMSPSEQPGADARADRLAEISQDRCCRRRGIGGADGVPEFALRAAFVGPGAVGGLEIFE